MTAEKRVMDGRTGPGPLKRHTWSDGLLKIHAYLHGVRDFRSPIPVRLDVSLVAGVVSLLSCK